MKIEIKYIDQTSETIECSNRAWNERECLVLYKQIEKRDEVIFVAPLRNILNFKIK